MEDKKNVVFVLDLVWFGGTEIAMLELFKKIHNKYNLILAYKGGQKHNRDILKEFERYAKVIDYRFKGIDADTVVWCGIYFGWKFSKKMINAKKKVAWIHSEPNEQKVSLLANEEFVNDIDIFVNVSEYCDDLLHKFVNGTEEKSIVIHNEINAEEIIKKSKEYTIQQLEGLKIVTVSRISPEKGLHRIKSVIDYFKKNNIKYTWVIVGEAYNKEYEQEIKSLLKDDVVWMGKKYNPYPFMLWADYVAQLSDKESYGIVPDEALILGTPVIVTDIQAFKGRIQDGQNGYVFDLEMQRDAQCLTNVPKIKPMVYSSSHERWFDIL